MRKCLRCGTEMKENCAIKVEGAGYGIVMSSDENKLFGGRIGKPKDRSGVISCSRSLSTGFNCNVK